MGLALGQVAVFGHKESINIFAALIIGTSHFCITGQPIRGAVLEGQF